MKLGYIDKLKQKEWEDLVKRTPTSGFMQSFFWSEFKQFLGWETFKIGIFEKEKLIGGAIVSKYSHYNNLNFLCIPEGPVLPYGTKKAEKMFQMLITEIDKIANLSRENLSSHLSIEPKLHSKPPFFSRFKKAKLDQQPIKTLIIDLSLPEEELLIQMKPKGRYSIKIAQKNNVEIIETGLTDGLKDFLELYSGFVKRQGFKGKDKTYFESLVYVLKDSSDTAKFYFAKYKNKLIAVALVIYYGDTSTFLFGASTEQNRNTMATYLLHWEIIKAAKKRSLKYYDFYSLAPNDEADHPWYGFSIFKRKFGGTEVNFIGAYDFIYNEKVYNDYLVESEKD